MNELLFDDDRDHMVIWLVDLLIYEQRNVVMRMLYESR